MSGSDGSPAAQSVYKRSFRELFEAQCPYYMSIGMSYDEYWHQDANLVKYYQRAEEIRIERRNEELWLQGLYIYEAMCEVAPLFRFSMKGGSIKAKPYREGKGPIPLTERAKESREEAEERERAEKIKAKMLAFAENAKKKRAEQEKK